MKRLVKTHSIAALMVGLISVLLGESGAQTLTTLHSFNPNIDGAQPVSGVVLAGSTLYGTASEGSYGNVFSLKTDGTGFTVLHSFSGSDGAGPKGGLLLSGNSLFGTTLSGVFSINTDGTGFTNLHRFFAQNDGMNPVNRLVLYSNFLYGTASSGGIYGPFNQYSGSGTLFKLNTNSTGFSVLYHFSEAQDGGYRYGLTNGDGITPRGLILMSNRLYGTTSWGGARGSGVIFALNLDGTGFTNLHSFSPVSYAFLTNSGGRIFTGPQTNWDGMSPDTPLLAVGNRLYGTALFGGERGCGTVFAINADGTDFAVLHAFSGGSDGDTPCLGLTSLGDSLYGAIQHGGTLNNGVVFTLKSDGTGFTVVHNFSATETFTNSSASSQGDWVVSVNKLYGTTPYGGSAGNGSVFSLSLLPQLMGMTTGSNLVLRWPTNFAGFNLQSIVNLGSVAGWQTVNLQAPPIVVNGQYLVKVTNTLSSSQKFYRLSQ